MADMTAFRVTEIMREVHFPGYTWLVHGEDRTYLQSQFTAPDCKTGNPEPQFTRKWYISRESTKSEVVQTAFKCVLTSLEHEAREVFTYRGQPVFGPHFDVDHLAAALAMNGRGVRDERETA